MNLSHQFQSHFNMEWKIALRFRQHRFQRTPGWGVFILMLITVGMFPGCKGSQESEVAPATSNASSRNAVAEEAGDNRSTENAAEPVDSPNPGAATAQQSPTEWALKMVQYIDNPFVRVHMLNQIAAAQLEAGMNDQALATVNQALPIAEGLKVESQKQTSLGRLAETLIKAGKIQQGMELIERSENEIRIQYTLLGIVSTLGRLRRFDRVRSMIDQIEDESLKEFAINRLTRRLVGADQTAEAVEYIEALPQQESRAFYLIGIASALIEVGKKQEALETMQRSLDALPLVTDPERKQQVEAGALLIQANVGDLEEVLKQLQDMEDETVRKLMLGDIISMLTENAQPDKALILLPQLTEEQGKEIFARKIALAFAEAGQGTKALTLMQNHRLIQANDLSSRDVMIALAREGHLEQALEMIEEIKTARDKSDACSDIARTLAEQGDFQEAEKVAGKITEPYTYYYCLCKIAGEVRKTGDVAYSEKLFQLIKDKSLYDYYQGILAVDLAKAGKFEESRVLVNRIINLKTKSEALIKIASTLAVAGNAEQAVEALSQAISMAEQNQEKPDINLLLLVLAMELDQDQTRKAIDGVFRMKKTFTPKENQLAQQVLKALQ
ncbi:hypothetical protein [Gimesia sp.]|uniref:tetratricopeptide repeat protein n=1 Tax=Gimesia sp. TaxID=2024833 RepID=UPI003A94BC26